MPAASEPIGAAEFVALMQPFEPFEPAPCVAVAVSGGPDSLALTILLDAWARARGGRVVALTVDHGLRPESAAEARWVGEMLAARGIAHAILPWRGDKPGRVRQEDARAERYLRLRRHCAAAGILHLAIGHHRADRAETVLLRLRAGSDLDGLAGIAHQREMPELRLIRPLLTQPKDRLRATLRAQGLSWVEDPSNSDPGYARVRMRQVMPLLAGEGLGIAGINAFAAGIGQARQVIEAAQNRLLARAAWLHPAGFAWLDAGRLMAQPERVARGALARVLLVVGGRIYPPRTARLECARAALCKTPAEGARTLGGCRLIPRRGAWLVVREAGRMPRRALPAGAEMVYDGRFELTTGAGAAPDLTIGPLGGAGWAELCGHAPHLRDCAIPAPARAGLPAVRDSAGVREVPALGWVRPGVAPAIGAWRFAPRRALTGAGFTVAQ